MVRTALVAGLTASRGIPTAPVALVGCMSEFSKKALMARLAWVVYMMGIKRNPDGSYSVGGRFDGFKRNPNGSYSVGGMYDGYKETLMARLAWVVYMMGIKEILMVRTALGGSVFEPLERSIRQPYSQKF